MVTGTTALHAVCLHEMCWYVPYSGIFSREFFSENRQYVNKATPT